MATIREEALAHEQKHTKNVSELPKVDLSWPIEDREGMDNEGVKFQYKVFLVGSEEYRIPGVVLGSIKDILQAKPEQKFVKVLRKGTGKATQYTVLQVE